VINNVENLRQNVQLDMGRRGRRGVQDNSAGGLSGSPAGFKVRRGVACKGETHPPEYSKCPMGTAMEAEVILGTPVGISSGKTIEKAFAPSGAPPQGL